ncbi:MAG: O-methyltransferase, partial [Melioribacteraceae bacterium]|nr:O-methyltransferase [Melioribacteraceae bacterium]
SSVKFLEQLVKIHNTKNFLEIGTAIGYSTIRVAKNLQTVSRISTIEVSKDNIKLAKSFFDEANLTDRINILEGDAREIIPKLKEEFDFIFLDADKEDYLELFELSIKVLKDGGIILVDNLLWHGFTAAAEIPEKYKKSTEFIRKFNAQFLSHPKLISSILPIGDGLGLGIKYP